ncbi:hypothetical protein D3C71_946360 [compost metagenome]
MVEAVGLQIFRQVGIDEPDFIALVRRVGFGDIRLAFAQRLDLGAGQHEPCLVGINDLVVETGLAVFRNDLVHHALAAFGGHDISIPCFSYCAFGLPPRAVFEPLFNVVAAKRKGAPNGFCFEAVHGAPFRFSGVSQFIRPACFSAASMAASVAGSSVLIKGERTRRLPPRVFDSAYLVPQTPGSMKMALCSGIRRS